MTQGEFERRCWRLFAEFEDVLDKLEARQPIDLTDFPAKYRQVCQNLGLARQRSYDAALVERLNLLALRGHQHLYGARRGFARRIGRFVAVDFPRQVRKEARLLLAAALLMIVPALGAITLSRIEPEMAHALLGAEVMADLETMYDPASPVKTRPHGAESDLQMLGFYILNNVGIAFRTFAGGALFGVGTVVFLAYNGLFVGASTGYILELGYGETFLDFVSGHVAFELGAIGLAGVAGLQLGGALVAPGRLRRRDALVAAARESIQFVYGAAGMLLAAACIEAFWSARGDVPGPVKHGVGASLALLLLAYFLLAGRRRGP